MTTLINTEIDKVLTAVNTAFPEKETQLNTLKPALEALIESQTAQQLKIYTQVFESCDKIEIPQTQLKNSINDIDARLKDISTELETLHHQLTPLMTIVPEISLRYMLDPPA